MAPFLVALVTYASPADAYMSLDDRVTKLELTMFTKEDAAAMRAETKADAAAMRAETKADALRIEEKMDRRMILSLAISQIIPVVNLYRLTVMDSKQKKVDEARLKNRNLKSDILSIIKYLQFQDD